MSDAHPALARCTPGIWSSDAATCGPPDAAASSGWIFFFLVLRGLQSLPRRLSLRWVAAQMPLSQLKVEKPISRMLRLCLIIWDEGFVNHYAEGEAGNNCLPRTECSVWVKDNIVASPLGDKFLLRGRMSQCPKWTWDKYSRREEHLEGGSTSLNFKEIFLPFKEFASLLPRRRLREWSSTLYYQSQAVALPEIEVRVLGDLSRLRLKKGS